MTIFGIDLSKNPPPMRARAWLFLSFFCSLTDVIAFVLSVPPKVALFAVKWSEKRRTKMKQTNKGTFSRVVLLSTFSMFFFYLKVRAPESAKHKNLSEFQELFQQTWQSHVVVDLRFRTSHLQYANNVQKMGEREREKRKQS